MNKHVVLGAIVVAVFGVTATHAQEEPQKSSDDEAIRESIDEYCAAFNQGKIDELLSYWSDDANYVDGDGQTHQGKEEIGSLFKRSLENLKGSTLELKIENLHFAKPDVAIEDGIASVTGPDGEASRARYTAVWVKDGDRWRISSAHDISTAEEPAQAGNAERMQSLNWLIGDWKSDDDGQTVQLHSKWALDKNYIVQDYAVSGEEGDDLRVMQLIGFDPLAGQIKSWTFDSLGGYGEGLWQQDGNSWSSESTGVLPDGRVGSAMNHVRFVDDSHMEWRSTARNVEGQPMADTKVTFVRVDDAADDDDR